MTERTVAQALNAALGLPPTDTFEAVASEGEGVLDTLTTISKRVVRMMRSQPSEPSDHTDRE